MIIHLIPAIESLQGWDTYAPPLPQGTRLAAPGELNRTGLADAVRRRGKSASPAQYNLYALTFGPRDHEPYPA